MVERSTITQVMQVGVETTPGTSVSASKLMQALSITPGIQTDVQLFRPSGGKFPTLGAEGREWVEASFEGLGDYEHLVYLLSGILGYTAPTKVGENLAYKWTHKPAQTAEDTIKTYTVEHGSSVRAGKFTYGLVNSFTLSFDRNEVTVGGSMIGKGYTDGITMTASPTAVPVQPILPTELSVYLNTSSGTIGTTKLLRVLRGEININDRYGTVWPVNSAISGFDAHVEVPIEATMTLLVEADASGMAMLPYLRSGAKSYIRVEAIGPTIETSYTYKLTWDMAGIVSDVGEFSDEDGVYAIEWTFTATYDSVWSSGTAMTVEVINTRSAL